MAERYRLGHGDARPSSLDALVQACLDAVPIDPYSERPLLYRADDRAYTIYSVGPDLKDDGGDLTSLMEQARAGGARLPPIRGADLGVRVRLDIP